MKITNQPVNDINTCLQVAQYLAGSLKNTGQSENKLFAAINSLAGDKMTGFLAYIIWRSRSLVQSSLR